MSTTTATETPLGGNEGYEKEPICCPLCVEEMNWYDVTYRLQCMTPECDFNYCMSCLQKLFASTQDGYSLASDGSNQVKVQLQCPQCRGSYDGIMDASNNGATILDDQCAKLVVSSVLLLRQAASMGIGITTTSSVDCNIEEEKKGNDTDEECCKVSDPGLVNDSDLSATELSIRNEFLDRVTVKELQEATRRLRLYNASNVAVIATIPDMDWSVWGGFLNERAKHHGQRVTSAHPNAMDGMDDDTQNVLARDPTLFLGLEDLLSIDEQEFLTSLLVSGTPELLAQAASILHAIVDVQAISLQSKSHDSNDSMGTMRSTSNNTRSGKQTVAQIEHIYRIRKRFPLPPNMPRTIRLDIFDASSIFNSDGTPNQQRKIRFRGRSSSASPFEFVSGTDLLELKSVRGPAGRLGIRRGDIITHINTDQVVGTQQDLCSVLAELNNAADRQPTFTVTVNCSNAISKKLRNRAIAIKAANVKFY